MKSLVPASPPDSSPTRPLADLQHRENRARRTPAAFLRSRPKAVLALSRKRSAVLSPIDRFGHDDDLERQRPERWSGDVACRSFVEISDFMDEVYQRTQPRWQMTMTGVVKA